MKQSAKEAQTWARYQAEQVPCSRCGRYSKRRVGEKTPRRPIDWYRYEPSSGTWQRPVRRLAKAGAPIDFMQAEMKQCVAMCAACARRK